MKFNFAIYAFFALTAFPLFAHEGGVIGGGGGGDVCEDRFNVIRDDIRSWVIQGGSGGLSLPDGVTLTDYNSRMLEQISKAHINCSDDEIKIKTSDKTCMNFLDANGLAQIVCNRERFLETSDSDQYVLVHHEYAGLAKIEVNHSDDSTYTVSNQISKYLRDEVVKRLAVIAPKPSANHIKKAFNDFLGTYKIVKCTWLSSTSPGNSLCDDLKDARLTFTGSGNGLALNMDFVTKSGKPARVAITEAWEMSEEGVHCATFYGRQYCGGLEKAGAYSDNFSVKTAADGLTYLISENSTNQGGFSFNSLTLVLKKVVRRQRSPNP